MRGLSSAECTVTGAKRPTLNSALSTMNYFSPEANWAYYSASQVKQFMACEAAAMAELNGEYLREKTQALLVGGYIDAHFSRELDLFRAQNPEIYTRTGSLRSEYQQAEKIIARIERDPLAMRMLEGDRQMIVTGAIGSLPFKAKLDCFLNGDTAQAIARDYPDMDSLLFAGGAIVDMKIMRDFKPLYRDGEGRQNFIEYWKYDLQLSIYQELMRQRTGEKVPCYILAATKENTPEIGLFEIPQELMDANMEILLEALPRMDEVKHGGADIEPERCGECEWCRQSKVLTCATWLENWA